MHETIAIATLGCKANQFDSALMEASLEEKGFEIVRFPQRADIYIVNTGRYLYCQHMHSHP